jgi:hypothetical protein
MRKAETSPVLRIFFHIANAAPTINARCFISNAPSNSVFWAEHGHILSCCSPYIGLFQALANRFPTGQDKPGASAWPAIPNPWLRKVPYESVVSQSHKYAGDGLGIGFVSAW